MNIKKLFLGILVKFLKIKDKRKEILDIVKGNKRGYFKRSISWDLYLIFI